MKGIQGTSNKTYRQLMGNGLRYIIPKFQRDYTLRILLIFCGLLLVASTGTGQTRGNRLKDPWVYEAMDKGLKEVKIFIQFILEPSGKIPDDSVKALKTFYGLEKVAEKAVRDAPDYKYANGIKTIDRNQKVVIPIVFTFDNFTSKEWSDFHKIKGQRLIANGNKKDAIQELEKSIKLNKKNGESYYILGQLWAEEDKSKSDKYFEMATKHGFQK